MAGRHRTFGNPDGETVEDIQQRLGIELLYKGMPQRCMLGVDQRFEDPRWDLTLRGMMAAAR